MGLDMYLTGKKYLSEFREGEAEIAEAMRAVSGSPFPIKVIEGEAGYWRKANAVHQWFVRKVQEGEDDCNEYDVGREDLEELLSVCRAVLADKSKAGELLPTQDGFFFGSVQYDEWYFSDIESTIKICEAALAAPRDWWFTYRASW